MKRYVKAFTYDEDNDYFGKEDRDYCGRHIENKCHGWLISKRMGDKFKPYSLKSVASIIWDCMHFDSEDESSNFDEYTILRALEGMCHEDEAVEVGDGFYYVGSYADWKADTEAHQKLEDMVNDKSW